MAEEKKKEKIIYIVKESITVNNIKHKKGKTITDEVLSEKEIEYLLKNKKIVLKETSKQGQ
ncbi:MAG: hypothetical protein A2086_03310 [Spirochaetes bacterium GWD1_27_9]|nr:MAG: hypothetical protein A2Z98_12540 [Spirochaetes bacterium GWB1_27_13]OHD45277.1 MAG: hypothetical protein A2086_03310 [Spirochaetes bacterium GWD1_27_9]